jgi:hypothetical protein
MIRLLAHPFPPRPVSTSSTSDTQEDRKRYNLMTGGEEEGGREAESYDWKKAWSSINHSIFSAASRPYFVCYFLGVVNIL